MKTRQPGVSVVAVLGAEVALAVVDVDGAGLGVREGVGRFVVLEGGDEDVGVRAVARAQRAVVDVVGHLDVEGEHLVLEADDLVEVELVPAVGNTGGVFERLLVRAEREVAAGLGHEKAELIALLEHLHGVRRRVGNAVLRRADDLRDRVFFGAVVRVTGVGECDEARVDDDEDLEDREEEEARA